MVNKKRVSVKPEERREQIVALLHERQRVSVDELAERLDSSRETVRRDLGLLADTGRIRKYHGGAMRPDIGQEGPFSQRMLTAVEEKRAIARAAAELYDEGDTVFVDTGTTTLAFAQELSRRAGVVVITNGVEIARIISDAGGKVFVIGGEYRSELGETVGPLAIEQIDRFQAAHAVIAAGALDSGGPMDFELEEAQIARAMVRQARFLTVLVDSSKLDKTALFRVCPLNRLDRLVVDRAPNEDLANALEAANVTIIIPPLGG